MATEPTPPRMQTISAENAEVRARHSSRSVANTVVASASSTVIGWVTSLIGLSAVPRLLGAEGFGIIATVFAIQGFVITLGTFGTGMHMMKGAARDPSKAALLFAQTVALRSTVCAVLSAAALIGGLIWIDHPDGVLVLGLILLSSFPLLIGDAAVSAMQAHHAVGRPAMFRAIVVAVGQLVTAVALWLGYGVVSVAVISLVTGTVVGIGTTWLFWRRFRGPVAFRFSELRSMATDSGSYLSWDIALLIYGRIDQLLLAAMVGTLTVGLYAFAYRLISFTMMLPALLSGATYPALSASAHGDDSHFRSLLSGALRVGLLAAVPAAGGVFLLAGDLPTLLAGPEFAGATPVVMLLALHIPFVAVDTILSTAMFALDRQRAWARVGWGAAIFNPLINLMLIPLAERQWGNGAIGAASATLITELLMTGMAVYYMRAYLGAGFASIALRALGATAAMALAVLVGRESVGIWVSIPIGAATYAVAAYLTGLLRVDDISFAASLVRRAKTEPVQVAA